MNTDQVTYQTGIPEKYRVAAVDLYDEAFGKKFSLAVRNKEDRKKLFTRGLALKYAIGAVSQNGLLGIAGFHAAEGSLTGAISYRDLVSQLGFFKGNRAAVVFSFFERKPKPGELVMDGIAVRSDARGMGVGSTLLDEIRKYAKQHDYNCVRLDVVDTNPKAKKLYEHLGFVAVKTESFPYLKNFLGFGGVTTMELSVHKNT
jgi:ribosomal protein S18 acetylase RimI-like enzyme